MAIDKGITRRELLKTGALGAAGAAFLAACGPGTAASPSGGAATAAPSAAGSAPPSAAPAGSAAASAAGGYTPPAAGTTGTLTISNWGDPNDQAVYKAVSDRFKAKYPNVTIADNFTPITTWSDYINKILADVAAGKPPDVINIAIEGVKQGISKQLFMPLSDFVSKDPAGKALTDDTDPRLLAGLSDKNTLYLLPNTWNTMLIYYNTKMFQAAGLTRPSDTWTWDDFLAAAKKLTTGSGSSKVFGFAVPYFNFGITPWIYTNDTSQLNADWTASNLKDPKVVEAVTFVRDLVTVHNVAPQPKGADPYQLFPAGKAAMTGAGHWVVGSFKQAGFTDYDIVPWPQKAKKASVYGVSGFGIHPKTKSPELAWEYAKELAAVETQKAWVKIGGANPALRSVAESADFLSQAPHSELYYNAIDYALPVAAPIVFSTLDPSFMRAMDSMMAGAQSPADALAQADSEVTAAFADAK